MTVQTIENEDLAVNLHWKPTVEKSIRRYCRDPRVMRKKKKEKTQTNNKKLLN